MTEKDKIIVSLYKIRLIRRELTIFEGSEYDKKWSLLMKSLEEDFKCRKEFEFVHPKHAGVRYVRHYTLPLSKHFALLKVGRFRTQMDYAMVAINLSPKIYDTPYVVLAGYVPAFKSAEELAEIVTRAFNKVLEGSDVRVILEPWDMSTEDKQEMYKRDCVDSCFLGFRCDDYITVDPHFGFEQLNAKGVVALSLKKTKKGALLKSDDFMSYFPKGDPDRLVSLVSELIKSQTRPLAIVRPIAFLVDHEMMERPTFTAFLRQFRQKKGLLTESSFNRLIRYSKLYYKDDLVYKNLADTFRAYM